MLDGDGIACHWVLNDEVAHILFEHQPWQSAARDSTEFASKFGGPMGFAGMDGAHPQSTPMLKTPIPTCGFLFRGLHVGDQSGTMLQRQEWGPSILFVDAPLGNQGIPMLVHGLCQDAHCASPTYLLA